MPLNHGESFMIGWLKIFQFMALLRLDEILILMTMITTEVEELGFYTSQRLKK